MRCEQIGHSIWVSESRRNVSFFRKVSEHVVSSKNSCNYGRLYGSKNLPFPLLNFTSSIWCIVWEWTSRRCPYRRIHFFSPHSGQMFLKSCLNHVYVSFEWHIKAKQSTISSWPKKVYLCMQFKKTLMLMRLHIVELTPRSETKFSMNSHVSLKSHDEACWTEGEPC